MIQHLTQILSWKQIISLNRDKNDFVKYLDILKCFKFKYLSIPITVLVLISLFFFSSAFRVMFNQHKLSTGTQTLPSSSSVI